MDQGYAGDCPADAMEYEAGNNRFFDERVRAEVDKELASRGFEKTTSGMPDLLIHYHANITQKIDVRDIDREYAYCDGADCRPFVYDAGTLFVDLVDTRTNKLVWRGWAEGSVDGVIDNQEWMEARGVAGAALGSLAIWWTVAGARRRDKSRRGPLPHGFRRRSDTTESQLTVRGTQAP